MADQSKIEWTDATWNPIAGCSPVSPGCAHCYAATMARRLEAMGQEKYAGTAERRGKVNVFTGVVRLDERALPLPLEWLRPRRIFVSSMSDLFHERVPDEWIARVFAVMALCPDHTFQVLTKRPERMADFFRAPQPWIASEIRLRIEGLPHNSRWRREANRYGATARAIETGRFEGCGTAAWPLENVWLGTSVEDQERADERIPWLLQTPAAVRFLSCEPLLGPVSLAADWMHLRCPRCGRHEPYCECDGPRGEYGLPPLIDWVIAGGESGPRARPVHPAWVRGLLRQCQAAGVPFFFKQWGEWLPTPVWSGRHGHRFIPIAGGGADETAVCVERVGKKAAGRLLDGREWNEFPQAANEPQRRGDAERGA